MRLLSFAAGVCPELEKDPVALVHAAADAGWPACGIWFDADSWTDSTTTAVRRALDATGLVALDMEVIRMGTPRDQGERLIEAAAQLGAPNILTTSSFERAEDTTERFATLCDLAAPAGLRVCLEFMRFSRVPNLGAALDVVGAAGRANGAILVDLLHLARSKGTFAELRRVDPSLLPYAQWCDGDAEPGGWTDAEIILDAVDGRRLPGTGELQAGAFLEALPHDLPLSVEVRSKVLRGAYPDATERARATLEACRTAR